MSGSTPSRGRAMPSSFRASAPAAIGASPSQSNYSQGGSGTCSLMLIGDGQAAAKTPYNETFIQLIKSLPENDGMARWHPDERQWSFPAAAMKAMEAELKQRLPELDVVKPPKFAVAMLANPLTEAVGHDEAERLISNLPAGLMERLFPYQRVGVATAIRCGGRTLLADEMGLGKTVQAICIAACFPEDWPLMIVCPKSMRLQWLQELHTWLPPERLPTTEGFAVIATAKDIEKVTGSEWRRQMRRVLIVSYDLLKKMPAALAYSFGVIIADESHALKEASSKRTQVAKPIMHAAKRVVLLTGTPALSRPIELYPQLDMVTAGRVGSLSSFGQRYCCPTRSPFGCHAIEYKGSDNIPELHALLNACGMIRRLKKDVLCDLPAKQRSRLLLPPQQMQCSHRQELTKIKKMMAALEGDSSEDADFKKRMLLNELYSATGNAKAPLALEHIKDLLAKGIKVVAFAHHREVLDVLQAGVAEAGMSARAVVRIDGSTEGAARQRAVQAFQTTATCRLALLSIMAAGVGLTLTEAQAVVFAELVWTPAALVQAEDRAHRVGQTGSLQVHYLQLPGSIDDMIWPVVAAKLQIVGATLDGRLTGSAKGLNVNSAARLAAHFAEEEMRGSRPRDDTSASPGATLAPALPPAAAAAEPPQHGQGAEDAAQPRARGQRPTTATATAAAKPPEDGQGMEEAAQLPTYGQGPATAAAPLAQSSNRRQWLAAAAAAAMAARAKAPVHGQGAAAEGISFQGSRSGCKDIQAGDDGDSSRGHVTPLPLQPPHCTVAHAMRCGSASNAGAQPSDEERGCQTERPRKRQKIRAVLPVPLGEGEGPSLHSGVGPSEVPATWPRQQAVSAVDLSSSSDGSSGEASEASDEDSGGDSSGWQARSAVRRQLCFSNRSTDAGDGDSNYSGAAMADRRQLFVANDSSDIVDLT